jgi:hypothetical protein
MKVKNGKPRQTKDKRRGDRGKPESESTRLGTVPSISGEHGSNALGASGDDSHQSNTTSTRKPTNGEFFGKIASQLIEEAEKQLAYHKQQTEILKETIKTLKQMANLTSDADIQ